MTLLPVRRRLRPRPDTFEQWRTIDGRPTCTRVTWVERHPRLPENPRRLLTAMARFAVEVWTSFLWVWGAPRAMLRLRHLPARQWRCARDHIYHIEGLVRRLLLIAALCQKVALAPLQRRAINRASANRVRENANAPATWCVSFSAMPPDLESENCAHARGPRRRLPQAFIATRGLARRMEALSRAMQQGRQRARRLAFRLARLAERNARANRPRLLGLRVWDFHPCARTPGKHAVQTAMRKAAPLSVRLLTRWNMGQERWEPG